MGYTWCRKIVCAACKFGDIVICGARHYDAVMHKQIIAAGLSSFPKSQVEQGFIDNLGQFLTREQALIIAKDANQISYKNAPEHILFSEDLY